MVRKCTGFIFLLGGQKGGVRVKGYFFFSVGVESLRGGFGG